MGKYEQAEINTAARLLSTAAKELWAEENRALESKVAHPSSEVRKSLPPAASAPSAASNTLSSPLLSALPDEIAALPGTKPAFWQDTYLFQGSASVVATGVDLNPKDESEMPFVVLDATVFHPQGGGQPTDVGTISCGASQFNVTMVRQQPDGIIKHYGTYTENSRFAEGDGVMLAIDGENRIKAAKSHTAGHLLDIAMQRALAPAVEGGMAEDMHAQVKGNMKGLKGYHFVRVACRIRGDCRTPGAQGIC